MKCTTVLTLLLLWTLVPNLAQAQRAYRFEKKAVGPDGQELAAATVLICAQPSQIVTQSCRPAAVLYPDSRGSNYGISSISCATGTVTVTTDTANEIPPNQWVTISGVKSASFNGTFQVTSSGTSQHTFTYASSCMDGTSSGGAVTGANPTYANQSGDFFFYAPKGSYSFAIASAMDPANYSNLPTAPQTPAAPTPGPNSASSSPIDNVLVVDGKKFADCANAAAGSSSKPTLIILPSSYSGRPCSNLPPNVTVLDLTQNATLTLLTNPKGNATGAAVGLEINVGTVPPNPGPNNEVVFVPQISCTNGIPCWDENIVAFLDPHQPDTYVRGSEADIDIGYIPGQQPRGTAQYIGFDAVSGWNYQPTYGLRTNAVPGEASWRIAFDCEMSTVNCFYIFPNTNRFTTTQPVVAKPSPQTVTTNVVAFTAPVFIGQWISIDSGPNHEDVRIQGVARPNILIGTFTKNHASGTPFYTYTVDQFWNPGTSVSREYPYLLGDIQAYNRASATHSLGWSVVNSSGSTVLYDYFDSSNSRHFRDANSNGWIFENSDGRQVGSLDSRGAVKVRDYDLNNPLFLGMAPTISSGFGPQTAIGAANGTASFTIIVGSSPSAASATLGMPTATNGWNCMATDKTTARDNLVRQSGGTLDSVELTNFNNAGTAIPPGANDIIGVLCAAY